MNPSPSLLEQRLATLQARVDRLEAERAQLQGSGGPGAIDGDCAPHPATGTPVCESQALSISHTIEELVARLHRIEEDQRENHTLLREILNLLAREPQSPAAPVFRDFYTTAQFAELVGRSVFTVRKWRREGRIKAVESERRRGRHCEWLIPHEEYLRYMRLPLPPKD
jgi:hypothetical protein